MTTERSQTADAEPTVRGQGMVRQLLEFLQSDEGREVVRTRFYEPLFRMARDLEQALAPLRTPEFAAATLEFL